MSKFKESKLTLNHLLSCPKTTLRSLWNCILLGFVINIVVSSVNKIGIALCSMVLGKSLIYTPSFSITGHHVAVYTDADRQGWPNTFAVHHT